MAIVSRPSPNFMPGRQARVDRIVWHHTGGAFGPALNWVQDRRSRVSYHFMVDRQGQVFRTVAEGNTAWHAGTGPMNARSIGICFETGGFTAAARDSGIALVRDLCRRFGLPVNRVTNIRHREVPGHRGTACPGTLPIDEWVRLAAVGTAPAPSTPQPPIPAAEEDMLISQRIAGGQLFTTWIGPNGELMLTTDPIDAAAGGVRPGGRFHVGTNREFLGQAPALEVIENGAAVVLTVLHRQGWAVMHTSGRWPWRANGWNWRRLA